MYTIYKITEEKTGLIYVGITSHLAARLRAHKCKLFRNKPFECEVLCKTKDKDHGLDLEEFWIKKLNAVALGYNQMIGREYTQKVRDKMSKAQKKRWKTEPNPFLGKKHTEETKRKMSAAKKGKPPANAGHNSRVVQNIDTGEIFPSATKAAEKYGLHKGPILKVCHGTQHTSGGYRWKFV